MADGRDLVIILADGRRIVVPDGAIILPQLVVGETAVPPANLAALLLGNEPEPAAGAPQSSGGNFFTDPGEIQAAFDIGNLLPYTELSRPIVEEREVIPAIDDEPEIDIEIDNSGVRVINAEDVVDEAGLPARGQEPQGTEAATDSETTYGYINFNSPDGVGSISINGVAITSVGQTFSTDLGRLVITSIEAGRIGYDYILEDNTLGADADFFEVVIADADGDSASATLRVAIVDDGPIGVDDAGTVPAASHDPINGNVLANDISGADNFPVNAGVTGFSNAGGSALPGATLQGTYGVLKLNADGSYSYTRDDNTPGGRSESFDYKIVDQDGTVSDATLVITIEDSPTDITFVPVIGEGTVVDEGGLPPRDEEPVGTGEGADGDPADNSDPSETTGSTITFTSPDGVQSVTINGVAINPGALPQTIVQNGTGALVVTGYTYDPISDAGSITYVYTLADNT
ncbi:MAG: Ig-like domain-containing protein, partial [Pseudomonadota bacterium]